MYILVYVFATVFKYFFRIIVFFLDNSRDQTSQWEHVVLTMPSSYEQVVFEGTRGGMWLSEDEGDIAIDNIWLSDGPCNNS